MSEELYVDGLGLAPGVMETIVAIAAKEVEGVASVGSSTFTGLRSRFAAKPAGQGIDVSMNEEQGVDVAVAYRRLLRQAHSTGCRSRSPSRRRCCGNTGRFHRIVGRCVCRRHPFQ